MRRTYDVAPQARADLADIASYLRIHAGEAITRSVLTRLKRRFAFINRTPMAGRPRPELGADIRSVVSQRWVIFYHVTDARCSVMRILDGARDVEAEFRKGPAL